MPLIQFYTSNEDLIRFKKLTKEEQIKLKGFLRGCYKSELDVYDKRKKKLK